MPAAEALKRRRDKQARHLERQRRKAARDEALAALAAGKPLPSRAAAAAAPASGSAPALDLASSPVAFLFPGQGSQAVGMLQESAALPAVQAMLATAQRVLGYDLLELCSKGGWRGLMLVVALTCCVHGRYYMQVQMLPVLHVS